MAHAFSFRRGRGSTSTEILLRYVVYATLSNSCVSNVSVHTAEPVFST